MPLNSSETAAVSQPLETDSQQPPLYLPVTAGMPARTGFALLLMELLADIILIVFLTRTQNFWCAHSDCNPIISAKFSARIQCNLIFHFIEGWKACSQIKNKIFYFLTQCSVFQRGAIRFSFPCVIREETIWIFSCFSIPHKTQDSLTTYPQCRTEKQQPRGNQI